MLLEINPRHPEPRKIGQALAVLERGGLIAYPTDTVYGLGCDLMNKQAIERLYVVKNMQKNKSLAFICHDLSDIAKYAVVDNWAYRILKHNLPGPYTFILPATREVPKMVLSKQKTVGIRVPDHPVVTTLARELGRPIISSTAAPPGEDAMIDPSEIDDRFKLDLVLDGGVCGMTPTTVVDLSEGQVQIVREGAGPIDDLVA
ncbi:MAG: threonylcarbamoyl-AMP synthase [Myxococcales bacterium]|jgi:tRNA threonylcarbamoyl adenosine modification protein (Sua5/YciO/YrdC/YwlC family)|nr:threonylcarbamoyl-AMP synthase [Myxococcales bacterium]